MKAETRTRWRFERYESSPLGGLLLSRGVTLQSFSVATGLSGEMIMRLAIGEETPLHRYIYPVATALGIVDALPPGLTPSQRDEAVVSSVRAFIPSTRPFPRGLVAIASRRGWSVHTLLVAAHVSASGGETAKQGWITEANAERFARVGVTREELADTGIEVYVHTGRPRSEFHGNKARRDASAKATAIASAILDGVPEADVRARLDAFIATIRSKTAAGNARRAGESEIRRIKRKQQAARAHAASIAAKIARSVAAADAKRARREVESAKLRAKSAARAEARRAEREATQAERAARREAIRVAKNLRRSESRRARIEAERQSEAYRAEREAERAREMAEIEAQIAFRRAAREAEAAANAATVNATTPGAKPPATAKPKTVTKLAQAGHGAVANAPAAVSPTPAPAPASNAPAYRIVPAPRPEPNPVPLLRPDPPFAPRPSREPRPYPPAPVDAPISLEVPVVTRQAVAHAGRGSRAAEEAESKATQAAAAAFAAMLDQTMTGEVTP